jgi:hypothetical protein
MAEIPVALEVDDALVIINHLHFDANQVVVNMNLSPSGGEVNVEEMTALMSESLELHLDILVDDTY